MTSYCKSNTDKRCVINMSLGGGASATLNAAAASAVAAGVVVVVAAGNDNANACNYSPASEPAVITVGSTTSQDEESFFSNHGTCVNVFAPGSDILSAWYNSNTASKTISGTSMASPRKFRFAEHITLLNSLTSEIIFPQFLSILKMLQVWLLVFFPAIPVSLPLKLKPGL